MEKMDKISKGLELFLDYIREMNAEYCIHESNMTIEDKRTQDLLHELELGPSRNKDTLATKLRKSRKERRIHKDFIEIYSPLYEFMSSKEGVILRHKLEEILGAMRKQEKHKSNRFYVPRIKDDTNGI